MTLDRRGWAVHGVDNNMRRDFFGPDGDTTAEPRAPASEATKRFEHHELDVRDRARRRSARRRRAPGPRSSTARRSRRTTSPRGGRSTTSTSTRSGTLNLLEAARASCPGVAVRVPLARTRCTATRRTSSSSSSSRRGTTTPIPALRDGIDESCRIDATLHSLFGASKAAADLLVQEYGRYFGMPTVCFRGGCLTGSNHASAELHGFLAYLARCVREGRTYRIYGYKGKQVRDNIHASDVCAAALAFAERAARGRRLQHRRRPRELGLDPRGDRAARGADRRDARRRVRRRGAARRSHLLHQRPPPTARATTRAGTSRSRSTRSSTTSRGRRSEARARHRRRRVHRLAPDRSPARATASTSRCSTTSSTGVASSVPPDATFVEGDVGDRVAGRRGLRGRARSTPSSTSPGRRASGSRSPSPRSICGRTSSGP